MIPSAKPPEGFTEDQMQKAVSEKGMENLSEYTHANTDKTAQPTYSYNFDGMYVIRSSVDSRYTVFKYQVHYSDKYYLIQPLNIWTVTGGNINQLRNNCLHCLL